MYANVKANLTVTSYLENRKAGGREHIVSYCVTPQHTTPALPTVTCLMDSP
jgi:hypothetical protein